ncbi:unnamed protein product [Peronospora belbahrii]|uniref:Uncharacterized protein n=1 Tax=Peronospora belbahrii TaxID=622444 RepID=A0ABN8CUF7_9STRA|nr:unnamed protein product [Peronospora belbahrii]
MKKPNQQQRAPTTSSELSENSSDEMSEPETSRESTQCRNPRSQCLSTGRESKISDKTPTYPVLNAVYSFARAGLTTSSKLFVVKSRLTPTTPMEMTPKKKPHCHSVDPVFYCHCVLKKTVGVRVGTSFGLGRLSAIRDEDGVSAIELETIGGLLYLNAKEMESVEIVPALVNECVSTPSGLGRVVHYDTQEQLYTVRVGTDSGGCKEKELQVPVSDVRLAENNDDSRNTLESQRPRGMSEGSNLDWDSRRSSVRLSAGASSASGLTMLKNIAATSYTFIASKYHQGQPVITKFGAGHIVSVDPQRGSAHIQLVWGAIAYLNANMIDYYPKALEGTDVRTKFGSGIVIGLRPADAIYTVRLHDLQPAGKSDVVFVHESDLHRNRRIAVKAANVRDKLKAMAQRRFGERIVVAHQSHDEEPNSAGI